MNGESEPNQMTNLKESEPAPTEKSLGPRIEVIRHVADKPLDDRWPDRFAAVTYAFAAFIFVISSL